MANNSLKTIARSGSARFTDRGSRFYAFASPIMDLKTVEIIRSDIGKTYPGATHYCYAWRFDPFQPREFVHDDGEPSGTAGQPILGVIKSEELINVVIIVARYFGGTKLGKPGLIQAYREAASRAILHVAKKKLVRFVPFVIKYPYDQEKRIKELVNRFRLTIEKEDYREFVTITLLCKTSHALELCQILKHLKYLGIRYDSLPDCFRPVN